MRSGHRNRAVARDAARQISARKNGIRLTWILPSMDPYGKAGRPKPEASGKLVGLATADRFSTYRPRPAPRRGSRPPCRPRRSRARETCRRDYLPLG